MRQDSSLRALFYRTWGLAIVTGHIPPHPPPVSVTIDWVPRVLVEHRDGSNQDSPDPEPSQRVCLEDTMSVSGCPPSIGARGLGGQCPDWSGETLTKQL